MHFLSFNIDRQGIRRAGMFAGPTADTKRFIHFRDVQLTFPWHHVDGFGGAMLGTGTTILILLGDNTIVKKEFRLAQLKAVFFVDGNRLKGTRRANLGTTYTVEITVAGIRIQDRLKGSLQPISQERWLQDMAGAGLNT